MAEEGALSAAYRRALNTPEGRMILEDISVFVGMTPVTPRSTGHMAGVDLSHAACSYRNGQQDLFKYIDGMASEK